ncbi:DUF6069 family protein [Nocardioides limicola]|uniref:DUF6069 family protein n=1 Tax=Nocardioides limicola TaxID=2803368 RepID=UPI00193B8558|nr:DUF6069 family protein [Nocardioides sp. DJM-14]
MTTSIATPTTTLTARRALRTGGIVLAISVLANVTAWGIARMAGVSLLVTEPGATSPTAIGLPAVVAATVIPLIFGTLALTIASRWGHTAWSALAWLGLALGVVTVFMPFTVDTDSATAAVLAAMHVVLGVVWFTTIRREVTEAA